MQKAKTVDTVHTGNLMNEKGITIIVLVVTIIVLLILAGVTIAGVTGENGIIGQTNKAKKETEIVNEYEQLQTIVTIVQSKSTGKIEKGKLEEELESKIGNIVLKNDNSPWIYEGKYKNYYIYDDGNVKERCNYSNLKIGDYVNYNIQYENLNSYKDEFKAKDEYEGWRILSINEDDNVVRLVSSGIPLTYYYKYNTVKKSVEELTTGFMKDTTLFVNYGFKDKNNNIISSTFEMKNLFLNKFTAKEDGLPKVQSLLNSDIENISGKISWGKFVGEDLLAIPCDNKNEEKYATYYLGTAYYGQQLWTVNEEGKIVNEAEAIRGIRPVVTLIENINFSKNDKESTDNKTVWNISL